jgi:hypothetical protein
VDRFLAFGALSQDDIKAVFQLLLVSENALRAKIRQYQLALPRHERLRLLWDSSVVEALAESKMGGGYAAGYAKHGASKCLEVLEQLLDTLSETECPHDFDHYLLSRGRLTGSIRVACVSPGQTLPAVAHDEM